MSSLTKTLLQHTELSTCDIIQTTGQRYANPIYYQSPEDGKEYIIIASNKPNQYVFFYDIMDDCFIQKYKYPETITRLRNHKLILDIKQNNLYIFSGKNIHILNLSTAQWTHRKNTICGGWNKAVYPYVVNNKIHFCCQGQYYTCYPSNTSTNNLEFDKINKYDLNGRMSNYCENEKLEYAHIQNRDKLLIIGGHYYDGEASSDSGGEYHDIEEFFDHIQVYDISINNTEEKEPEPLKQNWVKLNARLPYKLHPYDYIVFIGFESILFYFVRKTVHTDFDDNEIF